MKKVTIQNLFELLGGLGLFLFGMTLMSNGLEVAAGERLKGILEKLTANRFVGVGVGALVAGLTQSSSATTVMTVGFVNSGLMSLQSAVWIIMGANIGTTITGQLIALNISAYAPLILFMGVLIVMIAKKAQMNAIGEVLVGLGMLFMGLEYMSTSMEPLRSMPAFTQMLTTFQHPLIGIAVGAIFTAIIQSSSASVGILQSLAVSGLITLPSAIYVLFGQNIGTCITAVLAAVGAERNAKRATLIHLLFNIIGTIVFVTISLVTPFASVMASLTPTNVSAQIANVHTVFNIVTTLLLLPFGHQLVKLTYLFLPDQPTISHRSVQYLDFGIFNQEYHVGLSTIAGAQLFKESQYMLELVQTNLQAAFHLLEESQMDRVVEQIRHREDQLDQLNEEMVQYAAQAMALDGQPATGLYVKIASDLERIGDHALNIMEWMLKLRHSSRALSPEAKMALMLMNQKTQDILGALTLEQLEQAGSANHVAKLEQVIDDLYEVLEREQIQRLRHKQCGTNNSVIFAKILNDFERIGDHSLNIAQNLEEIHPSWQLLREHSS